MTTGAPDPALVAALAAAGAVVLGRPRRLPGVADRLGRVPGVPATAGADPDPRPAAGGPGATSRTVRRSAVVVLSALVVAVAARTALPGFAGTAVELARTTGLPGIAPAAAVAAMVAGRARRRSRGLADVAERRRSVTEGVQLLAAELRAGTPALAALAEAAQLAPVLLPAARAGSLGGSVPAALAMAARSPGGEGLGYVATAWEVSAEMGAGLADTMDSLVAILRAEDLARDQTAAALAAPRATARLLCVLPLAGLALGSGIGAHPWRTLTHTSWGPVLALAAVVLAGGGLEWVERLAATAADPGRGGRDRR